MLESPFPGYLSQLSPSRAVSPLCIAGSAVPTRYACVAVIVLRGADGGWSVDGVESEMGERFCRNPHLQYFEGTSSFSSCLIDLENTTTLPP